MRTIYRIERGLMTIFSTQWNKLKMTISHIHYGKNFSSCGSILFRNYGGNMRLGNGVNVNSHIIADPIGGQTKSIFVVGQRGTLIIGDKVGISNAAIFAANEVVIEDEAVIGVGCKIYDTDFHSIYADYRLNGNTNVRTAPIRVGERSFIGGHSLILKGVTIGKGAVVAAGSVITKSIPDNEVWGGNPAKFIKKIEQ